MRIWQGVLGLGCAAALAACAPTVRTHGYVPTPEALARIEVGSDTRGSVRRKIGRPTASGIFDERGWYYVSSRVEHMTYHEPEVVERTIVAVTFDEFDVVQAVDRFGLEDGRLIDLETRTTPTYGRQLTIIEQFLGNLADVTGEDILGDE
ncbi:MAG: outer membrane protein assembly factor BamE [Paracoccaceae bacterium]